MKSKILQAHFALLFVGLCYGLNYSIAKIVLSGGYIGPAGFILFRVLFGIIFFSLLLGKEIFSFPFSKKEWALLMLCGAFGVAINQICFFMGLEITSPINAALITSNTPVIVLFLSFILGKELFKWSKVLAILCGSLGAALIITEGFTLGDFSQINIGDLFICINATSYGIYLLLVHSLLKKYPSLVVVRVVFLIGFFYVLPFGLEEALIVEWRTLSRDIILAFCYVLLFATGMTYWLNAKALQVVSPPIVSIYIYLQPLIAALSGMYFEQHQLGLLHLVSGILIFCGILIISLPKIYELKRKTGLKST